MSAFRVQCETCQSWLRVRDEGFVGEVHACPKCGSMVLITHSAGQNVAPTDTAPSEPGPSEAPTPPTLAMGDTLEPDAPPPEAQPVEQPVAAELAEPAEPAELAAEATAAQPSPVAWAPYLTAGATLAAACAMLGVWAWSGSSPKVDQAAVASAPPALAEDSPPVEITAPPVEPEPRPSAAEAPIADTEPAADAPPEEPQPMVADTDVASPVEPASERAPEPAIAPRPERIAMATHNEPSFDRDPQAPPPEIDPLSLDPDEVELVLIRGGDAAPGGASPEAEAITALDLAESTTDNRPEPTLDERLAESAQHAGVFVRRGPTDAQTGPTTTPATAALAYLAPEVDQRQIPLVDAVQLLGALSGASITLPPDALRRAGVSPHKPLDLRGENTTLAALLDEGLAGARLAATTDGPHVLVSRAGADSVRTITHRLDDLIDDDLDGLNDLVRRMVPISAGASINASGELEVEAPMATHYDLLVLCERLRVARRLPTQTKYPKSRLPVEPSMVKLSKVLDRRTTFSFVEPTPLAEVIEYWRRATGLVLLVDWRSLSDVGLGPRTTIECSATNRPWGAALDGVLGPLGLAWAPADGGTLWLTSTAAAEDLPTIEFYPPVETDASSLERVDLPASSAVARDPASGALLIRAPMSLQRDVWQRYLAER